MPKAARAKAAKPEKATRKKKDPNAPKKALGAYMFFCKENRETLKQENPEVSFGELGKLLGSKWSGMSENEKKPYVKLAEQDKKRYQQEADDYGAGSEE